MKIFLLLSVIFSMAVSGEKTTGSGDSGAFDDIPAVIGVGNDFNDIPAFKGGSSGGPFNQQSSTTDSAGSSRQQSSARSTASAESGQNGISQTDDTNTPAVNSPKNVPDTYVRGPRITGRECTKISARQFKCKVINYELWVDPIDLPVPVPEPGSSIPNLENNPNDFRGSGSVK